MSAAAQTQNEGRPIPALEDFSDLEAQDTGEEITIESPVGPSSQGAEPPLSQAPVGEPGQPGGVQPPAGQQPSVATPAPAAQPAAAPPAVASTAPAAQPATEPAVQPAAGPHVPTTEEVIAARNKFIDSIAARYTVTDEQREQMLTAPEKFWPQMIAKTIVDTYDMVRAAITTQLPAIIEHHSRTAREASTAEDAFYKRWPALKKPELAAPLERLARSYRLQHPKLPLEQLIEEVGSMAHMALRIPWESQPAAPASSPAPAAAAPTIPPYRPAAPGGSPPAAGATAPASFWDEMAREALEDY